MTAKRTTQARRTASTGKAATARVPEVLPEVLPAVVTPVEEPRDLVETRAEGSAVASFIAGIGEFFRTSLTLEQEARDRLEMAKRLTAPTNAAEDEAIQIAIRDSRRGIEAVETHWSICQKIHALHRLLTTRRGIATRLHEEARDIAQAIHNRYVAEERRRVQAEQDRLRAEALQRAREEQEREARAAEDRALELENAATDLTTRESQFVEFYILDIYSCAGNAVEAAQRAGYKDPDAAALQLMKRPKVEAAIASRREAEALRKQAIAKRQQPVTTGDTPKVQANISRAAGVTGDRTARNGEVYDLPALVAAWKRGGVDLPGGGKLPVPDDLFVVDPTVLRRYAIGMGERIEFWPGVRFKEKTTTV